jgi:hypothetical protein
MAHLCQSRHAGRRAHFGRLMKDRLSTTLLHEFFSSCLAGSSVLAAHQDSRALADEAFGNNGQADAGGRAGNNCGLSD